MEMDEAGREEREGLPLAECVQAGQDFGVVVVVQADAAHQELLVYLPHHWTAAAAAAADPSVTSVSTCLCARGD